MMPPPEGRAPSKTRRIISFLSAHSGVGKSTVAFYCAVAWADWASCKVLYVPFDNVAGERFRRRLGIDESAPSEFGHGAQIHLGRCGVGVLSLARSPAELASMSPAATLGFLTELNRTYDLFMDSTDMGTLGEALLRESDHAFWITNSRNDFLRRDLKGLRRLRAVDSTPAKVDLVANRVGAPAMSEYGALHRMLDALGTEQIFAVPNLPGLDDLDLYGAGDNPKYLRAFLPMLIRVESVRPIKRAEFEQPKKKGIFSEALRRLGFPEEDAVAIAISKQYGIPYASRENKILKAEMRQNLKTLVPEKFARENILLPLFLDNNVLAVAIADPLNARLLDNLKALTGREIKPFIAAKTQILAVIDAFYSGGDVVDAEDEHEVFLLNAILKRAVKEGCSDIHLEKSDGDVYVRFRIGGALQERPAPPKASSDALLARIKHLAKLDVEERRLPQEGQFSIKVQNRVIVARVSAIGTEFGERVVLRLITA